jgi:hypothetical protein
MFHHHQGKEKKRVALIDKQVLLQLLFNQCRQRMLYWIIKLILGEIKELMEGLELEKK